MLREKLRWFVACAAAAMLLSVIGCTTVGQKPGNKSGAAASHPYLGGIWINPYGAHRLGDPENPKYVRPPLPAMKLTAKYKKLTEAVEQAWVQSQSAGVEGADPNSFVIRRQLMCIPYGLPRTMSRNMSLDIQQAEDHITIVGELDREVRRIWLDRPQKPFEEVDLGYWGRSVGHWEGDALVVNTIGVKSEVFGEDFMAHSDQMVMNERIWLKEPDILYDEITLTDPLALEEPFKFLVILARAPKDFEPTEFVCDQLPTHMIGRDGKLTINISQFNK